MATRIRFSIVSVCLLWLGGRAQALPISVSYYSLPVEDNVAVTSVLSTLNVYCTGRNIYLMKDDCKRSNAGFCLIAGTIQLCYGGMQRAEERDLKTINVTIGAMTVITSAVRMAWKNRIKKDVAIQPYYTSVQNTGYIGLSISSNLEP